MTEAMPPWISELITRHGDWGTFVAMFLESSIVPIPSEVVIAGAGAIGVPLRSIVIFGAMGSTIGAMVGYAIGRLGAMPLILKFGKFIFIKPHHLDRAHAFAEKYEVWGVLIGRLLPIIPFKVFSIASGITRIPFIPFVALTMIGVVPRLVMLGLFGATLAKYTKPTVLAVLAAGLIWALVIYIRKRRMAGSS